MRRLGSSHWPLTPECVRVGGLKSKLFFYRTKKNAFAGQTGIENFDSDIRKDTAYYLHYRLTLSLAIGLKSNNIIMCQRIVFHF